MLAKLIKFGCLGTIALIFLAAACVIVFRPSSSQRQSSSSAKTASPPAAPSLPPTSAPPPEPESPTEPTVTEPVSKWSGGPSGSSSMDDTPTVSYHLEAENTISAWLKEPRPTLIVRCRERETDVFVVTQTAANPEIGLHNEARVRIRLDDAAPRRQRWSESTNNEALFAPGAISLAKQLAKASTLRFEFTPFNSSSQVVTFDVRGFDRVIGEIAKPCGWRP